MKNNYYQKDNNNNYTYQDNHLEIKAIATALYLKKEESGLGIKSLTDALRNIPDRYAVWMFLDGAGIDNDSLTEIKRFINWDSSNTDQYLRRHVEIIKQRNLEENQNPYIPKIPDGEIEALEKDFISWERVFNGDYPYE